MVNNNLKFKFTEWLIVKKNFSCKTARFQIECIEKSKKYSQVNDLDFFEPNSNSTINNINQILIDPDFKDIDKIQNLELSNALKYYLEFLNPDYANQFSELQQTNTNCPTIQTDTDVGIQKYDLVTLIIEQLEKNEKEQRKIVQESYDIEDEVESVCVEQKASANIRVLKKWKKELSILKSELLELGFDVGSIALTKEQDVEESVLDQYVATDSFELQNDVIPAINLNENANDNSNIQQVSTELESNNIDHMILTNEQTVDMATENNITLDKLNEDSTQTKTPITRTPSSKSKSIRPIKITLLGETFNVTYWNELLIEVCEVMIENKPGIVSTFPKNKDLNSSTRINFSYNKDDIKFNQKHLSNNMWIETNKSAKDIKITTQKILQLCGYDSTDLVIDTREPLPDLSEENDNEQLTQSTLLSELGDKEEIPTSTTIPEIEQNIKQEIPNESQFSDKPQKGGFITENQVTTETINNNETVEEQISTPLLPFENSTGKITNMFLFGDAYSFQFPYEYLIKLCEIMIIYKPYIMLLLAGNISLTENFSYLKGDNGMDKVRLSNGIWVNKMQNNMEISNLCYKIINICGFQNDILQIKF